jgi:hypothetical protein
MESRYPTPRGLVEALHAREPDARAQCWEVFRVPLEALMERWIEQHGLEQDREVLTLHALHLIETSLRTRSPDTFERMSWTAFRAAGVLTVARSAFQPLDGKVGLVGPGPLPEAVGYQSETFFRPYERLASGWFGGDWYAGWTRPDGSLWVLLADVTGHGYHAHLLACVLPDICRRCWAVLTIADPEPTDLLGAMHDLLSDSLPEGIYLECTLARLGPDGQVTVAPAGGTRLLVRRGGADRPDVVQLRGCWLGLRAPESGDQHYWVLDHGDELLLATDGIFDQLDEFDWSGQSVGNGRLFATVRDLIERALVQGPQRDDLTMVFLRRLVPGESGVRPDATLPALARESH